MGFVPLRLLVCLGFEAAPTLVLGVLGALILDGRTFEVALTEASGVKAGCLTGDLTKADGEGIVIVAMNVNGRIRL